LAGQKVGNWVEYLVES
jgi:hypothetical protein